MAEVLVEFERTARDDDGHDYIARACGRECEDGHWEGWLEFEPLDGGGTVRTMRETTQPNRVDTVYWASGLSDVYLEGALRRALDPVEVVPRTVDAVPAFDEPAPERSVPRGELRPPPVHPILNPFEVYAQGEDVLRAELRALDADRLRDIVRGFSLAPAAVDLRRATHRELATMIVTVVQRRAEAGERHAGEEDSRQGER